MICKTCGFHSEFPFFECPFCRISSHKSTELKKILIKFLKDIFVWLRDRRFAIITKRQHIDYFQDRYGFYRMWWKYRLFDIFPIIVIQDSMSLIPHNKILKETTDEGRGVKPNNMN